MKTTEKIPLFAVFATLLILMLPVTALSSEYERAEEIAPASAEDAPAGIQDMEKSARLFGAPIDDCTYSR